MTLTGHDLKEWGFAPGPHFKPMLARANELMAGGAAMLEIKEALTGMVPARPATIPMRAAPIPWASALPEPTTDAEALNAGLVDGHMSWIMQNPMVVAGAVMPDACPAGAQPGTMPVGGVVVSRAVHPAWHSADICCSVRTTLWDPGVATPEAFMDAIVASTHFGPGGRAPHDQEDGGWIVDQVERSTNPFLQGLGGRARAGLATQGDGNHFASLGRLQVTPALREAFAEHHGRGIGWHVDEFWRVPPPPEALAFTTHHGSRDFGAMVYKRGQQAAVDHTAKVAPTVPAHQAWLDPRSNLGAAYLEALAVVYRWAFLNHHLIHRRVASVLGHQSLTGFGNDHNRVWTTPEGLFAHGKGATPAFSRRHGRRQLGIVPLNMAAPILLVRGKENAVFLDFAPHGAGRLHSRTGWLRAQGLDRKAMTPAAYLARAREITAAETAGLDVRFFFDHPDPSELPSAYKDAGTIEARMEELGLAEVVGRIEPIGCVMAGDFDLPWRSRKAKAVDQQADVG